MDCKWSTTANVGVIIATIDATSDLVEHEMKGQSVAMSLWIEHPYLRVV